MDMSHLYFMRICIASFLVFISTASFSQSLSVDQIAKVKAATVRVTLDSLPNMGTGFFINDQGWLLTCWHVIQPAFAELGRPPRKIFIELNTGEKYQVAVPDIMMTDSIYMKSSIKNDFALLILTNPSASKKFPFLELGNYNDLLEGQTVYTCGYPLGIPQQFVSAGMVSTKYQDTTFLIKGRDISDKSLRSQALLDLTLNQGNSGGAILKSNLLGQNKVVAIADFIIIPFSQNLEQLKQLLSTLPGSVEMFGINLGGLFHLYAAALTSASNGLSGCVSINHFLEALDDLKIRKKL